MEAKDSKIKTSRDDAWEDLVVSMLAVNQYSLEKTYEVVDGLRAQGLIDPKKLMDWQQGEIVERLKAAGCDRGPFMTNLFALRLANLGASIHLKGLARCSEVISSRNMDAIEQLLLPVNGIGPKVITNFYLLRGITEK